MKALVALVAVLFLACAGPEGDEGPPGPPGPQGERGLPGINGGSLTSSLTCYQTPVSFGSFTLAFEANRYNFSDGSVMTTCAIADWAAGYFGMNMYKPSQNGAQTGACFVSYDVDATNPTGGYFLFSVREGDLVATATYADAGSSSNNRVQSISCTRH
jgi:hypothetical protein